MMWIIVNCYALGLEEKGDGKNKGERGEKAPEEKASEGKGRQRGWHWTSEGHRKGREGIGREGIGRAGIGREGMRTAKE
eukprot:1382966-Prorocentrum_lima.AAC.1